MRLYVYMVMCGNICTLLYILFNYVLPCELPLKWRRLLLRANIVLYLMPFPWAVAEIRSVLKKLLIDAGVSFSLKHSGVSFYSASDAWNSLTVKDGDGKIIYILGYKKLLPFITVGFIVCLIALAIWMIVYIIQSHQYKNNMVLLDTDDYYTEEDNSGKKVTVGISSFVSAPVTVGLIKPVILLPVEYTTYEDAMKEVIQHELNHVSCKDILERLFCYMVIVFHFFNPLAYYLYKECVMVSEMISDETALKDRNKRQKAAYMRCMITASQKTERINTVSPTFGISKHLLKRRMERIMKINNKKVWNRSMTVVAVIVCVLASSIPAMAYHEPQTITQTDQKRWDDTDFAAFVPDGAANPMIPGIDYMYFDKSNCIFIDEEGMIYYCNDEQNSLEQSRNICSHNYVSGEFTDHIKKSDGSCVVTVYAARRCKNCGNIVKGEEISTITYKPCPH